MNNTKGRIPCANCGSTKISEVPNGKWWVDVSCAACGEELTFYRRTDVRTTLSDVWITLMQIIVLVGIIYFIGSWIIAGDWTK